MNVTSNQRPRVAAVVVLVVVRLDHMSIRVRRNEWLRERGVVTLCVMCAVCTFVFVYCPVCVHGVEPVDVAQ